MAVRQEERSASDEDDERDYYYGLQQICSGDLPI